MPKLGPSAYLEIGVQLLNAISDYQKFKEQEETKRFERMREYQENIEKIRAWKEMFLGYLEKEYEERYHVYSNLFKSLDEAIQKEQTEYVALIMNGILEQVKNDPLANFNNFKEALFGRGKKQLEF